MEIFRLKLIKPLYFTGMEKPEPFDYREGEGGVSGGEKLYCFDLDEVQANSFEPDKDKLAGKLVFGGNAAGEDKTLHELPQGDYLFAQKREILNKDEIFSLAVEIQQEGLWQRLELGKRLYLRYLFEDGSSVTQLFRPYEE